MDKRYRMIRKIFSWVIIAALTLVIAGFGFLHLSPAHEVYLVRSESMKPAINMGDLVVSSKAAGAIEPGTVITFQRNGELVTHRVFSVDGDALLTRGDALEEPDPWTVAVSDVRGVHLFTIPRVGYLVSFIRSKLGWFLLVILPGLFLVSLLVKEIIKEAFREEEEPAPARNLAPAAAGATIAGQARMAADPVPAVQAGYRYERKRQNDGPSVWPDLWRTPPGPVPAGADMILQELEESLAASMRSFERWLDSAGCPPAAEVVQMK